MSEMLDSLLVNVPLPKFFKVRQEFPAVEIKREDIPAYLAREMSDKKFKNKIKPGMSIAITAGSRGVCNIDVIIKAIVDFCKAQGAEPFVIPAMGSHGGGTAEGQAAVIASYGITEETMGCPIRATMEVKKIGLTDDGRDVVIDKNAAEADGIIIVNRVKAHTAFRGPYESGLVKMCAIGMAKQAGAQNCHDQGFRNMAVNIQNFGLAILRQANILFGVASIENAYDKTGELHVIPTDEIKDVEPELLVKSKAAMAKILVDNADLLIVDEIGKNYSGDGMDPNITGTFASPYADGGVHAKKVTVLGLASSTHGNAVGIGMAETTTKEVFDQLDYDAMYVNGVTCKMAWHCKVPCVMNTDKQAIQFALQVQDDVDMANPRIIRIPNSRDLEIIELSEAYLEEAKSTPGITVISEPEPLPFDEQGGLTDRFRT